MNQLPVCGPIANHIVSCTELMTMAERELTALFSAVAQLFGPEQARLSAEDWLHELTPMNGLPSSTREWRQITVFVSVRLAKRVNGLIAVETEEETNRMAGLEEGLTA